MDNTKLTKCPDCDSTISRRALWCVRCGRELLFRPTRWFYTALLLAIIHIMMLASVVLPSDGFTLAAIVVFIPTLLVTVVLLLESLRSPRKLP